MCGVQFERGGFEGGFREDSKRIRGGFMEDSEGIRGGFEEDSRRIRGGFDEDSDLGADSMLPCASLASGVRRGLGL